MIESRLPKLLAIDDDPNWLSQIPIIFEDELEVVTRATIDEGIQAIESSYFDVVLLDLNFHGEERTGFDVFKRIVSLDSSIDVIVISGETRPDRLIQIINAGVTKFISKPSSPKEVRQAVRDTLAARETKLRAVNLAQSSVGENALLVGSSRAMHKLREDIDFAVSSGAKDILLVGETGTGKEVVARTIALKADPAKRLIPIHCGAISDGLAESELFGHVKGAFTGADKDRASAFEAAGGGYVFLDEIGEMPLHQQAKLLRVLQERKVQRVGSIEEKPAHFRCISATNVNLPKAIRDKAFREDLYYRIAKFEVQLPALRDRYEDIPELVHFFLSKGLNRESIPEVSEGAMSLLQAYSWPGNVRQLQTVVEQLKSKAIRTGRSIREREVCEIIPDLSRLATSPVLRPAFLGRDGAALVNNEKKRFQRAIVEARGDRTKAAQLLNMSRATFFRRAKDLGLVLGKGSQDSWMSWKV